MAITKEEWNELKSNEQYNMYCKLLKELSTQTIVTTLLADRLTTLETKVQQHLMIREYCPHKEDWKKLKKNIITGIIDDVLIDDITGIDLVKEVTITINGVKINALMNGRISFDDVLETTNPEEEKWMKKINYWAVAFLLLLLVVSVFGVVKLIGNQETKTFSNGYSAGVTDTVVYLIKQLNTNGYITIVDTNNNSVVLVPYKGGEEIDWTKIKLRYWRRNNS